MPTVNLCVFMGNLGQDPKVHPARGDREGSKDMVTARLAVWQGKEQDSMWLDILAFGDHAARWADAARKGSLVQVVGKLEVRAYKDKDGVERQGIQVVAHQLLVLDGKPEREERAGPAQRGGWSRENRPQASNARGGGGDW